MEPTQELKEIYNHWLHVDSDIKNHLPRLRALADDCKTVVEFGARGGLSTSAFCISNAESVKTYDVQIEPQIERLVGCCDKLKAYEKNVLEIKPIAKCDLLFIDTLHTYEQLSKELALHGNKAQKYLVFHDTATFGDTDEVETSSKKKGLIKAISEFMDANTHWTIHQRYEDSNGLLVLIRE